MTSLTSTFTVSEEQVAEVLRRTPAQINSPSVQSVDALAHSVFTALNSAELARVERAALDAGDGAPQRMRGAYGEIGRILIEREVLLP